MVPPGGTAGFLAAQPVSVLAHRDSAHQNSAHQDLVSLLASCVCCVPLAVLALQRGSSQLFWVPAPSLRTAKQVLQALTSAGLQPGYYTAAGDVLLVLSLCLLLAGTGLIVGYARRRAIVRAPEAEAVLVLSWLVVPVGLMLVLSLVGHSIFQARYALVSLPAVSMLIAWALSALPLPRAVAASALIAVVALRALALAPSYGTSTEEWRAAARFVATAARPADCIAFYPEDARMPFEYYQGPSRLLPRPVLPPLPWGSIRSYVEEYRAPALGALTALAPGCHRMWLVFSHQGRLGGAPVSGANFTRLRRLRSELGGLYQRHELRRFGRASPISVELFRGAA